MNQLILEQDKRYLKKTIPLLKAGLTVKVHEKIKEGEKFRTQIFEGLIIRIRNQKNINTTITVRKIVDGIGVEKIFMVHSPNVEQIEVLREAKIRQANILYIRELSGKAARLKSKFVTDIAQQQLIADEPAPTVSTSEEAPAEDAAENIEAPQAEQAEAPAAEEPKTEDAPSEAKEEEEKKEEVKEEPKTETEPSEEKEEEK